MSLYVRQAAIFSTLWVGALFLAVFWPECVTDSEQIWRIMYGTKTTIQTVVIVVIDQVSFHNLNVHHSETITIVTHLQGRTKISGSSISASKIKMFYSCRKNPRFSHSDVCKWVPHQPKYETNIRLLLQRYTLVYNIHPITSARILNQALLYGLRLSQRYVVASPKSLLIQELYTTFSVN